MTDPQQPQSLPPKLELWEGSSAYVNQGRHWSSAIIWLSSSLFGIALVWAYTAKIDQTISVRGRLEPSGSVREVDAPSSGVVADVLVAVAIWLNLAALIWIPLLWWYGFVSRDEAYT